MGCGEEQKDTGFFIDIEGDTQSDPNAEPGNEPTNEPENPNEPDNPNNPDNDSGDDTDNDTDTGGQTGDNTTDDDGDGFSEDQGDGDDTNGQIAPGFVDFPGDGVDQDCSGEDTILVSLPGGVSNANFDDETDGYPDGWSNIGDAWGWQADGANIFTANGDTGVAFSAHTPSGGAVKLWGDYGANTITPGETSVFQEFSETDSWSPAGKIFWLTVFGYISSQDPVLAGAIGSGYVRCFEVDSNNNYNLLEESRTQRLDTQTQQNSWRNLSAWVHCGPTANLVQVVLTFSQSNSSTDHGVVYFDDLNFSEAQ